MDDDKAGDDFCEEDIDQILQSRAHVVQLEQGEKNSTFSKVRLYLISNNNAKHGSPWKLFMCFVLPCQQRQDRRLCPGFESRWWGLKSHALYHPLTLGLGLLAC